VSLSANVLPLNLGLCGYHHPPMARFRIGDVWARVAGRRVAVGGEILLASPRGTASGVRPLPLDCAFARSDSSASTLEPAGSGSTSDLPLRRRRAGDSSIAERAR